MKHALVWRSSEGRVSAGRSEVCKADQPHLFPHRLRAHQHRLSKDVFPPRTLFTFLSHRHLPALKPLLTSALLLAIVVPD